MILQSGDPVAQRRSRARCTPGGVDPVRSATGLTLQKQRLNEMKLLLRCQGAFRSAQARPVWANYSCSGATQRTFYDTFEVAVD